MTTTQLHSIKLELRFCAGCHPCDPSLGSLEDISPAQMYRADLNSVVFFLLSFVVINPARGMSETRYGDDLWQWSRLEISLSSVNHTTKTICIMIISHLVFKKTVQEVSFARVFKISLQRSVISRHIINHLGTTRGQVAKVRSKQYRVKIGSQ